MLITTAEAFIKFIQNISFISFSNSISHSAVPPANCDLLGNKTYKKSENFSAAQKKLSIPITVEIETV